MLGEELSLRVYDLKALPADTGDREAIYLGWLMAGNVAGYKKAASRFRIRCVAAVGMTPESPEQTAAVAERLRPRTDAPVFYLQGGYDYKKLTGVSKLAMGFKGKELLEHYSGMSEVEKQADPVYRMLTRGGSVVSKERLAPVIQWYQSAEPEAGEEPPAEKKLPVGVIAVAALGVGAVAIAALARRSSEGKRDRAARRRVRGLIKKRR